MGWNPRRARAARSFSSSAPPAACAPTTARRSRWATTPATGRSACSCRPRRGAQAHRLRPVRRLRAPTRATAARRARPGMMDSLPYRNDAAMVLRRLIRSLPTRSGVMGVATCDKGLPAMMMALAGHARPAVRARARRRHAAARPTARTRARCRPSAPASPTATITLEEAAELGCRACASPGGGCQFLGTAATSQVVGEALGPVAAALGARPVGPADLARHGRAARRGRCCGWSERHRPRGTILTRASRPQRDGRPRGVRRLDQPAAAHPRHRPRRRAAAADRRRLDRRQPQGPAPRRCAAQRPGRPSRPCASSSPAACPR